METQFQNIFEQLEKIEKRSVGTVEQFWKQISRTEYRCKISGRKMDCLEFFRFQQRIGADKFIIEVLK